MIISGDFNSHPSSSLLHMVNNRDYDPLDLHPSLPIPSAYQHKKGKDNFKKIDQVYQSERPGLSNIQGRIKSSYSFYKDIDGQNEGEKVGHQNKEKFLENWAEWNEECHPPCTTNISGKKQVVDYIFYSPGSMILRSLLKMPTDDQISQEIDLPSSLFPSDHLRIQSQFQVFYM